MAKTIKLYEPKRKTIATPREKRDSRHARGYDSVWTRRSEAHRKRNPLCVECERNGRDIVVDVVDHIIPVRDRPDLRLVPGNWWSLCHHCHQGIKKQMETYARANGLIDQLPLWCDDPATRPPALDMRRARNKEEMIV